MTGAAGRVAAVVAAVVVALLLGAGPAAAHAELDRSDPPDGGTVAVGRSHVTLWFGEPIDATASIFRLHEADGTPADVTAAVDREQIVELTAAPLPRATFVLEWRVVSADDGHASTGSIVFGVGARPVGLQSSRSTLPDRSQLILRWFDLSGLLLAIGALAVSGRVLDSIGALGGRPLRRARLIGAIAAVVAAVTGSLAPLIRTPRGGGSTEAWLSQTWVTLTGTTWGQLWLAREIAVVVAAGFLLSIVMRPHEPAVRARAAMAALVAAACLDAWGGHASALPGRTGAAAAAGAAHLVAAGVWAGGLVVLAVCVLPQMRRTPDGRRHVLTPVWRAFGPIAAVASGVLLASGLYEAGRHVPAVGALTSTAYGEAVAVKTVLVVVALGLAGVNTLVVNPGLAARVRRFVGRPEIWSPVSLHRFTTLVAAEAAVLVLAAGTAAVLTSVPTAREVAAATTVSAPAHDAVAGLFLTVEDVPSGPDRSRLIVRVRSTVLPDPAPVRGVEALVTRPGGDTTTVLLRRVEEGRYEADTAASQGGAWTAHVVLQRDGLPDAVSDVRWKVAAPADGAVGPLEVVATGAALVLLAGLSAAAWAYRRRRVPGPPRNRPPLRWPSRVQPPECDEGDRAPGFIERACDDGPVHIAADDGHAVR